MVKRNFSELNDGEYSDQMETSSSVNISDAQKSIVIADMIRMVLAKHSRHLKIRNEHFHQILQASNTKGNLKAWIAILKQELELVYGITLEQSSSEFSLVSTLKPESGEILFKLWSSDIHHDESEKAQSSHNFHMPDLRRTPTIINTPENFMGGFTILVISMIVLSENKISEGELLDNISDFGISDKLNAPIPVFNKTAQGVIADLAKRDYIKKIIPSGADKSGATAEYSLGARSKREFGPRSLYDFMVEIYQDVDVREQIAESIKRCFPEFSMPQEESTSNYSSGETELDTPV